MVFLGCEMSWPMEINWAAKRQDDKFLNKNVLDDTESFQYLELFFTGTQN